MNFKNLEELMDRLTAWRIPGAEIEVYKDNERVFKYASGYADVENKKPIDGSLYFLYSSSKVATSAAVMQLLERGEILLTDPVKEYMPHAWTQNAIATRARSTPISDFIFLTVISVNSTVSTFCKEFFLKYQVRLLPPCGFPYACGAPFLSDPGLQPLLTCLPEPVPQSPALPDLHLHLCASLM